MPLRERNHLRQFLLFVFVLLIPCFALWSSLSAHVATPIVGLLHLILPNWFPDIVNLVYQEDANAVLMTRFDQVNGQLVTAMEANAGLGFKIDTRIISYSIPFYAALHFATEKKDYLANFFIGLIVLYPLMLFGAVCICMRDLMVAFGGTFLEQPDIWVPGPNIIGIAYQLSVLIVPTLAPVLVWAWQSRDTPLLRGILGKLPPAPLDPGKADQSLN